MHKFRRVISYYLWSVLRTRVYKPVLPFSSYLPLCGYISTFDLISLCQINWYWKSFFHFILNVIIHRNDNFCFLYFFFFFQSKPFLLVGHSIIASYKFRCFLALPPSMTEVATCESPSPISYFESHLLQLLI